MTRTRGVSRREFAAIGVGAAAIACVPLDGAVAQTVPLDEGFATFDAPDGRMDGFVVHPLEGKHPGVIVWPDIAGLRDSFMSMGRRLARNGYSVLILNPFYREGEAPLFDDFDAFREQGGMDKVGPWRAKLTPEAIMETGKAAVEFLDSRDWVDTGRGIGVQGYCMGGPFAVWTAAAAPERVKAAASFHGAALVGEDATSPVNMIAQSQAAFMFAIARNDDRTSPSDKTALKTAADAAGRPAEIKVYPADHGWTVADSPANDFDEEDKAFEALVAFYQANL